MDTELRVIVGVSDYELGSCNNQCSHTFVWLHNFNYIGGAVMYWFMILAGAGFVSILTIVIVHLIEEYRHGRF